MMPWGRVGVMRLWNLDACCLSNGNGSEYTLSVSPGCGSESGEVIHCCWGWGLLGERPRDDQTGLGSRDSLPGLRILNVEHPAVKLLVLRESWEEGAKEMRSLQFYPRTGWRPNRSVQGSLPGPLPAPCESCRLFSLCRQLPGLLYAPLLELLHNCL